MENVKDWSKSRLIEVSSSIQWLEMNMASFIITYSIRIIGWMLATQVTGQWSRILQDKRELHGLFQALDTNRDGFIDREEIAGYLRALVQRVRFAFMHLLSVSPNVSLLVQAPEKSSADYIPHLHIRPVRAAALPTVPAPGTPSRRLAPASADGILGSDEPPIPSPYAALPNTPDSEDDGNQRKPPPASVLLQGQTNAATAAAPRVSKDNTDQDGEDDTDANAEPTAVQPLDSVTEGALERVFRSLDKRNTGQVDFESFVTLMQEIRLSTLEAVESDILLGLSIANSHDLK